MAKKIVFVSDTFHHHQKGVADALYKLTGGSYCFVTTIPLREERINMGFANEYPNYVLDASSHTDEVWTKAHHIIDDAEVVVLGSAPYELLNNRLQQKKITFRYSERLWKQYKHYLKTPFYMLDNHKTSGCRLLCASAFAAHDYNTMGAFRNKCYKWGYFPIVKSSLERMQYDNNPIKMMWCSRFLDWKHPELPIFMAKQLKDKGFSFKLDMYGNGQYLEDSKKLAKRLNVGDVLSFCGNASNDDIVKSMSRSDIFLFTSDRGEGWGVVANESMGCGCVLVASDEIGSVPYLVENGMNGCTFHSSSRFHGFNRFGLSVDQQALKTLTEKVEWLINNPNKRRILSENAIITIKDTWNPETAAKNFLTLIEDIKQGRDTSIMYGPCSKA